MPDGTSAGTRRSRVLPLDRWPTPERWAVVTVLVCASGFVVLTALIAVPGPVRDLDWAFWNQGWEWRYPGKRAMTALTVVGQRGPVLAVVLLVVARLARRRRSWRPLVVLLASQLLLNVVVGALKYGLGRAKAETGSAELLAGGTMYPSGHSANAVVVYGVLTYLLVTYGGVRLRPRVVALTALPSVLVAASTLFIGSHWVTDVVAGTLVGVALLAVTITTDRRWPAGGATSRSSAPAPAEQVPPASSQGAPGGHRGDDDDEPAGPATDARRHQAGAGQPPA